MNLKSMETNECLMCFNNTEKCIPFPMEHTEKMLNNCLTYLDPRIAIKPVCNNDQLFFCNHCFDFTSELNKLEDRLETLQNRLSNLSSTFSRAIMCRRQLFSKRKKETRKRKPNTVKITQKCTQGLNVNNMSGVSLVSSVDSTHKIKKIYLLQPIGTIGSQLQNNIRANLAETALSHPIIAPSCQNLLLNVKSETNTYNAMETIDSPLIHKDIPNSNTDEEEEDIIDIEHIKSESRLLDDDHAEAEETDLQENQIVNLEDNDDITILSDSNEASNSTESLQTPTILLDTVRHVDVDESSKADDEEVGKQTTGKNYGETSGGSDNPSPQKDATSSKNVEETSTSTDKIKPYKCMTCQQSFRKKYQLQNHMAIHTDETLNPFKCSFPMCKRGFLTNDMLAKHEKSMHMCPFCTERFYKNMNLETHIKTHTHVFTCQFCGKGVKGATAFKAHQKIHNGAQEDIPDAVDSMDILIHKNLPTPNLGNKEDTIDIENIKSESDSRFLDDDRAEAEEVLTNLQENQHDFTPSENDFANNSPKDKDEIVNSEVDDDITILSDSNETSKSTESFQTPVILINSVRHVAGVDETNETDEMEVGETIDENSGETSGCDDNKSPENDATSSKNVEAASKPTDKERPFKCMTCQQLFMRKSHLQIHETIHTGKKPYKCSLCKRSFRTNGMLIKHQRTHLCPFCTKTFSQKEQLEVHKKTHAQQPKCRICGKLFKTTSNLIAHERLHERDQVYKCSLCAEVFANTSKLKEHERFHTGEKPFECSFCTLTFASIDLLIKHEYVHEEDEMGNGEEQDV